jgi:hypothetical protein
MFIEQRRLQIRHANHVPRFPGYARLANPRNFVRPVNYAAALHIEGAKVISSYFILLSLFSTLFETSAFFYIFMLYTTFQFIT